MRMHKKRNLTKRLTGCEGHLISVSLDSLNCHEAVKNKEYFDFKSLFGNDDPVEMEIGCGKGGFICTLAKRNPHINYIAVEKIANVIVTGCERAEKEDIKNLLFLKLGAEYLPKYIPEKSLDNIYLNFSCPYPKNRHENLRLTNPKYLEIYKLLLKDGGRIFQKTDNMHFFEYSLEQFSKSGYMIENISLDLHNSDFENNIVTEYEKRFSDMGQPIYKLEAYIK